MQDETIEALEQIQYYFYERWANARDGSKLQEMFAWFVRACEDAVERLRNAEEDQHGG